MSTVGQVIADPDFAKLSPQDQQGVLTHFDPDFAKVNAAEFPRVVEGIRNKGVPSNQQPGNSSSLSPQGKAIASGQASPQVTPKMQPQDATAKDYYEISKPVLIGATAGIGGLAGAVIGETAEAAEAAEGAAEALPKAKTLGSLLKTALSEPEIQGSTAAKLGWKQFTDAAYEASAEALHSGKVVSAAKYGAAAVAGKAFGTYESTLVKAAELTHGWSAVAMTTAGWYGFLKEMNRAFSSSDEKDESDHR